MSKSPKSNIFIPAAGGAALAIGVAYGVATTNYGNDQIEALSASFEKERAVTTELSARADEAAAQLAELQASASEELAAARAEAEELASSAERRIAALQSQLQSAQSAGGVAAPVAATGSAMSAPAPNTGVAFGLGRAAFAEEIASWDVDVLPDGRGLPVGSGDVWTGEEVFTEKCAACHGDFAEGRDAWPVLAGGFDTLADQDPVKTVGSYWPYLSTVWDYVHRSMPFGNAGTLTADETYAITAYILYSNDLIGDDFVLSNETFSEVEMYNTAGFIIDNRPEVEYAIWRGEPCMTDCKSGPVEITRRSSDVGVTPADDGSMVESVMEQQLKTLGGMEWGKERVAGSVFMGAGGVAQDEDPAEAVQMAQADTGETATDAAAPGAPDPALVAKGEVAFKKCASCHQVGEGAKNRSGPVLNGVVGRSFAAVEGFKYSSVFQEAAAEGRVWDDAALTEFLAKPRAYLKGTRMSFAGFRDPAEIEAVIAYLKSFSE